MSRTTIRDPFSDAPRAESAPPRAFAGPGFPRLGIAGAALCAPGAALAGSGPLLAPLTLQSAFVSAIIVGLLVFSTTLALQSVRDRRRRDGIEAELSRKTARLRDLEERTRILLDSERQLLVRWNGGGEEPVIEGDPTVVDQGVNSRRVLAFGSWLAPEDAARIDTALGRLRERGEAFRLTLRTARGRVVDAEGRTSGGAALLRLRDVSDDRAAHLAAAAEAEAKGGEVAALRGLLDAIEEPAWLRDASGALSWTNRAYKAAVESGEAQAGAATVELLDSKDRAAAASCRARNRLYRDRVTAVMAGARRSLAVTEAPLPALPDGAARSGGIARDVTEMETLRAEIARLAEAHARVLDELPIAVATFDGRQRLVFHNAAYRELWKLPAAFLESGPSDAEVLDRLRAAKALPEQADFRNWRQQQLEAYRSTKSSETWWHLPDRRTIRVVTNPNPQGGLTYLYDDVSDRLDLETRLSDLTRVQGETLDTLAEGVALFGQDGRLKLFNLAFANLWRAHAEALNTHPHIDWVIELARIHAPDEMAWEEIRAAVSSHQEMRRKREVRLKGSDGRVIDAAAQPLPGGSTLLTFADVTAQVNVESALRERNEALQSAGRLRDEFVHHMSYELRTPLTNIIGFADLLGAETIGPLNERQREYAGHITRSSGSVLAIINDILDLASIDSQTIELARERVDIRATITAAAEGLKDRLVENELSLEIDVPAATGTFTGDSKRVRQVLYNLLSNAAGFSLPGQTIRVAAHRTEDAVVVSVVDHGRGIPASVIDRVFNRFETHTEGAQHRGVGLGLSIVRSFVELHGGRVELVSEAGAGTTVTCTFPIEGRSAAQLAASIPTDDSGEDS
ncbi:PAS-domain containing protein [Enterovirga sp.]|uniref:sensor histidine kinase n=1 Tax=Enterovirga sp. TaxID=2026350 RepID=UPI002BA623AA|nr:PAS-domain containing protein [Enterovirga sp.]HMO28491.1 PAS-domain containing protein [Enterovirga sp.]